MSIYNNIIAESIDKPDDYPIARAEEFIFYDSEGEEIEAGTVNEKLATSFYFTFPMCGEIRYVDGVMSIAYDYKGVELLDGMCLPSGFYVLEGMYPNAEPESLGEPMITANITGVSTVTVLEEYFIEDIFALQDIIVEEEHSVYSDNADFNYAVYIRVSDPMTDEEFDDAMWRNNSGDDFQDFTPATRLSYKPYYDVISGNVKYCGYEYASSDFCVPYAMNVTEESVIRMTTLDSSSNEVITDKTVEPGLYLLSATVPDYSPYWRTRYSELRLDAAVYNIEVVSVDAPIMAWGNYVDQNGLDYISD